MSPLIFNLCVLLPIYILLWGHGVGDLLCVDLVDRVQGQLHDEAVDRGVFVHLCDAVKNLQRDRCLYTLRYT